MKTTPVTVSLVVALLVVFALEVATGSVRNESRLLLLGALPNTAELNGQYWRLATYAFLHYNWSHLLMNVALLWWVGHIVERRVGVTRAALIYAGSVVFAALLILLVHSLRPKPGSTVGASGGIFGLLAAALVLVYRRDAAAFGADRALRIGLWVCLLVAVCISLLPGVSIAGHLAGFLWGLLLGLFLRVKHNAEQIVGRERR